MVGAFAVVIVVVHGHTSFGGTHKERRILFGN
jgi:hypothetical protein